MIEMLSGLPRLQVPGTCRFVSLGLGIIGNTLVPEALNFPDLTCNIQLSLPLNHTLPITHHATHRDSVLISLLNSTFLSCWDSQATMCTCSQGRGGTRVTEAGTTWVRTRSFLPLQHVAHGAGRAIVDVTYVPLR